MRVEWRKRKLFYAIAFAFFLYLVIRIKTYEYKTEIILPEAKPADVWEFMADFSNMKKLNPTMWVFNDKTSSYLFIPLPSGWILMFYGRVVITIIGSILLNIQNVYRIGLIYLIQQLLFTMFCPIYKTDHFTYDLYIGLAYLEDTFVVRILFNYLIIACLY